MYWRTEPIKALESVEAIFVGGGNTYALLQRLRESHLLARSGSASTTACLTWEAAPAPTWRARRS